MRLGIPVLRTENVVRPVCVFLGAMSALAIGMALVGWHGSSLLLGMLLAGMSALIVLYVHHHASVLRGRAGQVRQSARLAEEHYVDVLRRIVHFLEAADPCAQGHSRRVSKLAEGIARRLGMDGEQCRTIALAGELHDIGVLAVPGGVLTVPGKLSPAGLREVRQHCEVADEMLRPLEFLGKALPAIRHHHERMNGTGFPDGLVGDAIPPAARVLAVAEAYDAMTHDRPHRPAMSALDALRELERCAPDGFCPQCVSALAEIMNLPELETAVAGR